MIVKNEIQIKTRITINVGVSTKIKKKKVPSTSTCENGKYLQNLIDDSVVMSREAIYRSKKKSSQ